ncbi:MAG: alpha/beta fold hydrolase, partial [Candidatus Sulfotelmatobacter sp.]
CAGRRPLISMTSFESTQSERAVNPKLASTTPETLTSIWQRVLQRSSVNVDDNFFELGGSLSSADMIFAEIARQYGRELPSATIYHAPTIAALASVLERPTLPQFSPFVQLKAGTQKPPILIAHGLDGLTSFSRLAKHIRTGHPVYGIQARGVDGMEEPYDRIEDMAQFYLDALGQVQPKGPYILIGYSFGGLVALEMAQRLSRNEENVALLVLIDAYPHPRFMSRDQRLRLFARRIRRHLSEMKHMDASEAASYFLRGLEHRLRIARIGRRENHVVRKSHLSLARTTLHVKTRAYVALRHYRPQFYKGKIKFVGAQINSYFPGDPSSVWRKLTHEFEAEIVPGNHLNIVSTQFEGLADVLTRFVTEVGRWG